MSPRSRIRPAATLIAALSLLVIVTVTAFRGTGGPAPAQATTAPDTDVRTGDPAAYSGWGRAHFPHEYHVDDLEIACVDCHHETNASRLAMPHQDYFEDFWIDCTICHKETGETAMEPKACGECHPATPRSSADETLSAKVVVHQSCWSCHDRGTGAEAAENCSFCHEGPGSPDLP